jgi:hypothetical protein
MKMFLAALERGGGDVEHSVFSFRGRELKKIGLHDSEHESNMLF